MKRTKFPLNVPSVRLAILGGLSFALIGCAAESGGNRRDTMTQRQRDSVLAQTQLPNAGAVGKAMTAADSARARQAQLDAAAREP